MTGPSLLPRIAIVVVTMLLIAIAQLAGHAHAQPQQKGCSFERCMPSCMSKGFTDKECDKHCTNVIETKVGCEEGNAMLGAPQKSGPRQPAK
jgi:hypothetical protein